MRCNCPVCGDGALMESLERGLESTCRCRKCGYTCHICVGKTDGAQPRMPKGATKSQWEEIARQYGIDLPQEEPEEKTE